MAYLSLSFLGRFEVAFDAEPITVFGSDKARALLAYLAIESARPHRRAKLSGMFWPDLPEQKAAHNLSQSLLRLRQALGGEKDITIPLVLIITPQQIQFNTNCNHQLDVARFRQLLNLSHQHIHAESASCGICMKWLEQAADLYHGDLLAGLFVSDSTAFEEWRMIQQEELRQQALEALSRLTVYYEQRGNFEQVQKYARLQIALEPWHEAARFQLMRALVRIGQTSAAQKEYESYRHTLMEESGIKPSADITAFYEQIRSGELIQLSVAQSGKGEATWISDHGERRQVTALACSSGIEADSEELQTKLSVCERHCEVIFNRFGGKRTVRQGETCLVYFGYPQAYEDAARRAVHSALAVAAALEKDGGVRIGIHTGVMTVGEKRGRRWQDRDLIGKAPETARNCLRLADPGEVLVTEETRRLVQDSFDLQAVETSILRTKGPLSAVYHVRGEGSSQSRLEWLAQTQRLPALTGRQEELAQLRASHEKIFHGKGQVVLLRGEPGIGKSRLVWELEKIAPIVGVPITGAQKNLPPVLWVTSRCLPYNQNTSLHPIIGLLEGLLGFQTGDSADIQREKLKGMLFRYQLNRPSTIWLLSLLIGLPTDAPHPETITKAQREQMRQVFIALLTKYAAERPLVLVIEDLHWSDLSTIEWLGQSLDSLASIPCLTLLTARPGFNPVWLTQQNLHPALLMLSLSPLRPEQAEAIVTNLAGDTILDENILRAIVRQTDGVPLYLEELTRVVLERRITKANVNKLAEIPTTLLDSLVARLDHLGKAKETAQWAAVLGREFSYPILQACVPYDEQRLQSDLAGLIEAELVSPLHTEPQELFFPASSKLISPAWYTFKHALVQEAVCASMLKGTRQAHHLHVAETLEARFPQIVDARPELLAQHYFEAGMQIQAVDLWLRAGEYATAQGATLEARNFFDRAIESIDPADLERRWQALWGRETALCFRGERSEQKADIDALLELAEEFNDPTRKAQAQIRKARYASSQSDYRGQLGAADAGIAAASLTGALSAEVEALAYKVTALMRLGERETLYQAVDEILVQAPKVEDDNIRAYAMAAVALYYVEGGDLCRAIQFLVQCLDAARRAKIRHLDLESQYYGHLGFTYAQLGLYPQARKSLEAGLELANLMVLGRYQAYHKLNLGFVYWRLGDLDTAIQMEEQVLKEYSATGEMFGQAAGRAYLGYIYEGAGILDLAAENLAEARTGFAEIGVDPDKFEAQAVEARVILALGRQEEARQLTLEVWKYLCEQGTEGLSSPTWVYMCVADVLDVIEIIGISPCEVVNAGYQELMQKAEKINDPEWRRSFLENVAENRAIIERREKLNKIVASG